jgi:DNA repair protein RadC
MDRLGPSNVSAEILVAVLLRGGVQGLSVVELAGTLLRHYGSLTEMSRASVDELTRHRGMGRVKAQVLKAALELARRLSEESLPERPAIRAPEQVAELLREPARGCEAEVLWSLLLDSKYRLLRRPVEVSRGILDANLVHPREVFREAVRSSAAALVLAHNHPSGDPHPSAEDLRITRQLVEAGKLIDIEVLDHVILGGATPADPQGFLSLREAGVVAF